MRSSCGRSFSTFQAPVSFTVGSDAIHEALDRDERFGWKALRPRRLKGIGWTPLWVLTRPGEGASPSGLPAEVNRRIRTRRERRQAKEADQDDNDNNEAE